MSRWNKTWGCLSTVYTHLGSHWVEKVTNINPWLYPILKILMIHVQKQYWHQTHEGLNTCTHIVIDLYNYKVISIIYYCSSSAIRLQYICTMTDNMFINLNMSLTWVSKPVGPSLARTELKQNGRKISTILRNSELMTQGVVGTDSNCIGRSRSLTHRTYLKPVR